MRFGNNEKDFTPKVIAKFSYLFFTSSLKEKNKLKT